MSKPEDYEHGYADGVEWATKQSELLWAVHQEACDLWEVFEDRLRAAIGNTQYVLMKEKLRAVALTMKRAAVHAPLMEPSDHRGLQWPFAGCQCKACLSTAVNIVSQSPLSRPHQQMTDDSAS